jgi:hypothetical protein
MSKVDLIVKQELINKIIARARSSNYGLDKPEKSDRYSLDMYQDKTLESLALHLVDQHTGKYELVSLMFAAMEELYNRGVEDGQDMMAMSQREIDEKEKRRK